MQSFGPPKANVRFAPFIARLICGCTSPRASKSIRPGNRLARPSKPFIVVAHFSNPEFALTTCKQRR